MINPDSLRPISKASAATLIMFGIKRNDRHNGRLEAIVMIWLASTNKFYKSHTNRFYSQNENNSIGNF